MFVSILFTAPSHVPPPFAYSYLFSPTLSINPQIAAEPAKIYLIHACKTNFQVIRRGMLRPADAPMEYLVTNSHRITQRMGYIRKPLIKSLKEVGEFRAYPTQS